MLVARNNLCDKLFEEIKVKLIDFTATNNYPLFLKNKFSKLKAQQNLNSNEKYLVMLQSKDLQLFNDILSNFPNSTIDTDNTILIGGFKLFDPSKNIVIDCTLDNS